MPAELLPRSVAEAEDPAYWFLNTLNVVKATSESTGGAYSMICSTSPPGHETPYHLHHEEDEAFYVLDGEFTFLARVRRRSFAQAATSSCRAVFRMAFAARVRLLLRCLFWRYPAAALRE
jgi:hypothetical protein